MPPLRAELAPDQLLDEERVALGPGDDVADALLGNGTGAELVDETAYVGGRQGLDLDPLDAGHARPLGDLAAERVTAVEVVGAVGRDERDRGLEAAAEQEAHQVAGGLVGPVEVLDDQQQRALAAAASARACTPSNRAAWSAGHRLGVGRLVTASAGRAGAGAARGGAAATSSKVSGSSREIRPVTSEMGR